MKRKRIVYAIIASLMMMVPAKMWAGGLDSVRKVESKKALPYPRAERAVPMEAIEYDSIAGCFVVRDTIVDATARTLGVSGKAVVTKAASTTSVGGVVYGYFGNQLSSENEDEMKQIVESWTTEIKNIDVEGVLSAAPEKETWYMQIVGVEDKKIDENKGEMRIYNDIGSWYNYKTIAIDSMGLRNNEHIKTVVFEDCSSSTANANTSLKMVIHNGAFKGCKNLKEFNMYYLVTKGDNHYQMLYPWDIYIGDNVFDGCHEDFRIVVAPQLYNMFITDENWGKYADKIVASDYMPTVYDPIVHEGVTYDYATKSLNTLTTSELIRMQSSWWNAAVIGVEVVLVIVTSGASYAATSSAQAAALPSLKAAAAALNAASATAGAWKALVAASQAHQVAYNAYMAAMSNYTYYLMAAGANVAVGSGFNGMEYITSTIGNKSHREPTWILSSQWLMTENKHTIYHMYVKDVENKETVTLYNDMGSVYNYKTVALGKDAFKGKDKMKTLKFVDVNKGEMYESMTMVIPDSAFMGCTSLETVDLIMHSNYTNRDVALGPENFIVCGKDIFAGCDTTKLKIRIGAEKYEEFAENSVWGKYKNCFEVVDVPEVVDYTEFGAQYSYSFDNNTLKKQSYSREHTIEHLHIIGQDGNLEEQKGEVALFNDIGVFNNYKLDYVKKNAFKGSKELKGITMFDLKGLGATGDAYTDLEVVLQDSAFADCENLEYINMLYFRTDGANKAEAMSPSRVQLGIGVFAGSDKLKVKMVNNAIEEFKSDTAWVKYEDKFLPSFILTEEKALKNVLKECGMRYTSPVSGGGFDVYDVMQVTDPSTLSGKFQAKEIESFRDFKTFECIDLKYIGDSLFKDCKKLQSIELPSTVDSIGNQAFYNCALLDDVVIPSGVKVIGEGAFGKCASMKTITFVSETPATLGDSVFAGMPEDYVLYVPEAKVAAYKAAWPEYADHIQSTGEKHTGIWEVTVSEPGTLAKELGLTITGTNPLTVGGNYHKYDKLKISGAINGTDIGVIRFMGGRDVNNCDVTYAANLKYLDLYDADIKAGGEDYNQDGANDRVTEDNCIDTYMFWELDKLETLILPKSVTKIKNHAFNNCDELSRLVIGDSVKSIGAKVTHDSPKLQEVIMLCDEAPATDKNAWSEKTNIGILYTPNSIREHISGSRVYYTRCDSIASPFADEVVLRALADKRIYTSYDIAKLSDVENLINGNSEIKTFNELVMAIETTKLGDNSLSDCSNLEEVILPLKVESITAGAFDGCTSLKTIKVYGDSVPTLEANAFESLPEDFVIYVTIGKEDAYRKAWPQYADHIQGFKPIKDEVKEVTVTEAGTLADVLGFSVSMSSANDIGRISGNLMGITALKVNGPINGKDIAVLRMLGGRDEEDGDEVVLARMTYLDLYDATICTDPDKICFNRDGVNDYVENDNEIPEHMFWKLDKLQTVILPKNVTKIDDNAFYDCLNVETIVVGDATKKVGNDAFGKCKNLKNIVFLCEEKPELDGDAFTDPISDQPYRVEKMYVPLSLLNNYVADKEFTTHTKEFSTNFEEDDLFRAFGARAVLSKDQLRGVTNIEGWFNHHNGVVDLSSLSESAVDTIKSTTLAALKGLKKIALPATVTMVEENAFASNTELQWIDLAKCEKEGLFTEGNIAQMRNGEKTLIYAPENMTVSGITNVVYGKKGDLKCDHLALSDSADYEVPREFKAKEVSYSRMFAKGAKSTLCLPFDMELPEGAKVYMLTSVANDTLIFTKAESVAANQPYVIVTDEDMYLGTSKETLAMATPKTMQQVTVDNYTMMGTLASVAFDARKAAAPAAEGVEEQRVYTLTDAACWNVVAEGKQVLSPYHAYVQTTKSNMPSVMQMRLVDGDSDDVTTAVEEVNVNEIKKDDCIYDIYGRRVKSINTSGVYLVNGKKVLVK